MSEMSDPINNPPSYYLLPDGTEIREMIRQVRGDESTIEHLAQSIMEYASRLGKKPGASRADDFRKIARCAIQGANVCEGRSVSDNGDPPTGPADPDLGWVAGYVRRNRILHLYGRSNDICDNIACGGQFEAALVGGVQLHPADKPDTIPTPAPPTNPDQHALATAIRQAIAILAPRANCVTGVGCDIQAAVNTLTDAIQESPAPAPPPDSRVHRAAVAMLAAMRGPHGPSWSSVPAGNAPNHGHSVPGVWDQSNDPDRAGKPCEWCAAWNQFVAAVEGEPAPASAPPPEPERPSITLPVVFGGDRIPANGVYLALDSRGNQMVDGWAGGYRAPSTMIGPLPSERGWPKRSEGEGVPPPEPEPVLDQHEDGVYLPNSRKACHARIRRLDRELTEASEHLQKVVGHGVGILCVADAAKAIVEPLLRPHVTLPVVFGGERVPASGVYVGINPAECEWSAFFITGHTAPSPIIGPIPPACEWPTKPDREGEDA